jgi:hypothetical protein
MGALDDTYRFILERMMEDARVSFLRIARELSLLRHGDREVSEDDGAGIDQGFHDGLRPSSVGVSGDGVVPYQYGSLLARAVL